jgi:hypothetical protein
LIGAGDADEIRSVVGQHLILTAGRHFAVRVIPANEFAAREADFLSLAAVRQCVLQNELAVLAIGVVARRRAVERHERLA